MNCPFCGQENSEVIETRDSGEVTRRRRECTRCRRRFTSYERVENLDLIIIKKDGRREKFDREKLRRGLVRAAEKRPIATDTIESIVGEIERELRNKNSTEISSKMVGNLVLKKLKKIDKVAYVRFASVYLDFEEIADFEKIIEKLT